MAKNENTESTAMTELERMLTQNVQGTPEFREQADRRALEQAQQDAEQAKLIEATIAGPKPSI